MQSVIIDTNVIVSSIIQQGYPNLIVSNLFLEDKIQLCISDALLKEYYDVLARPKFSKFLDFFARAESLLVDIETKGIKFIPTKKITLIKDEPDNRLLELAEVSQADFLITGNTNDFIHSYHNTTKIVTPKVYWDDYKPD